MNPVLSKHVDRRQSLGLIAASLTSWFTPITHGQDSLRIRFLSFAAGYPTYEVPARGSLATLYCDGLGLPDGVVLAEGYPLPFELSGVRVRVASADAPILGVAGLDGYQLVNFQVPLEADIPETRLAAWPAVQADPEAVVEVRQGNRVAREAFRVSKSPGEFFKVFDDGSIATARALLVRTSDGTVIADDNPARSGDVVTGWLTGTRAETNPMVPTGEAAPLDPPAVIHQRPDYIDAYGVVLAGAGGSKTVPVIQPMSLVPGVAGVCQVRFEIDLDPGQVQIRNPNLSIRLSRNFQYLGQAFTRLQQFYSRPIRVPVVPV